MQATRMTTPLTTRTSLVPVVSVVEVGKKAVDLSSAMLAFDTPYPSRYGCFGKPQHWGCGDAERYRQKRKKHLKTPKRFRYSTLSEAEMGAYSGRVEP